MASFNRFVCHSKSTYKTKVDNTRIVDFHQTTSCNRFLCKTKPTYKTKVVWSNMSRQRSLRECLGFAPLPCDEHINVETFRPFSPPVVSDDMMFPVINEQKEPCLRVVQKPTSTSRKRKRQQFIAASHQTNKRMTSRVRSLACNSNTQTHVSSLISPQVLTTSVKVSGGFWDMSKKDVSQKLWWLTRIDWRDSEAISSSGYVSSQTSASSMRIVRLKPKKPSLLMTSWPSCTYSLAGRTVGGDISEPAQRMRSLPAKEKKRRSVAYKGKTAEQKKAMKPTLDQEFLQTPYIHTRSKRVKLRTTPKQFSILMHWLKDARKTYNLCLRYVLDNHLHHIENREKATKSILVKTLRAKFITAKALANTPHKNLLETPKVLRDSMVSDIATMIKAFHTNFDKQVSLRDKYPHAHKFKDDIVIHPKYKSTKRIAHDSMAFERKSLKLLSNGKFSLFARGSASGRILNAIPSNPKASKANIGIATAGSITKSMITHDMKLHFHHQRWYLICVVDVNTRRVNRYRRKAKNREDEVAIDPGVRKFASTYCPTGAVDIIGTNTNKVVDKLRRKRRTALRWLKKTCARVEASKIMAATIPDAKKMRKAKRNIRNRIRKARRKYHDACAKAKNTIRDIHYKVSHYLCRSYSNIMYPSFDMSGMVSGSSKLSDKVKERLSILSHGAFRTRLCDTANMYPSTRIKTGSEAYTSKTCGNCGVMNMKLGASEVFKCNSCGRCADRDIHAARNIFLRNTQKVITGGKL